MTVHIQADETKPIPRPLIFRLTCDRTSCPNTFAQPDDVVSLDGFRKAARAAGWGFTAANDVFCPACKVK